MKHVILAGVAAVAVFVANPASAAELLGGGCATDLSFSGGSSLITCYGRLGGNTLSNNAGDNTANNIALDALGYLGPDIAYNTIPLTNILSPLAGNNPNAPVNFPTLLNGTIFVGIHAGGGGPQGIGNSTSFYKINAVNLDLFTFQPTGASTATLFAVVESPVPEPATWAMLLIGFGAIGGAMRAAGRKLKVAHSYA